MRALDWSRTSLGPIAEWSEHLKSAVNLMLPSKAQIVLFWGPNFVALYNDAYAPTIGDKHPRALGRPAQESWTELWDDLGPLLRRVLDTGETVFAKDRPFYIERHGYPESVYFDISYSPVQAETGRVEGVLCIVSETTERVVAQAALARAQERLTQALSAAGMVGTFAWHVQTDTFYSDARFAEMFSVDPAKGEKGAPLADYLAGIHPEDVERIANAVNHTVATQEKYAQEYRLVERTELSAGSRRVANACMARMANRIALLAWWWT
jgi:PAS domain-containing protein